MLWRLKNFSDSNEIARYKNMWAYEKNRTFGLSMEAALNIAGEKRRIKMLKKFYNFTFEFALFHYPIFEWDKMHYGSFHLYGHVHNADLTSYIGERSLNVCYDNLGRMISLQEVISMLKNKPIKPCVHNGFLQMEE